MAMNKRWAILIILLFVSSLAISSPSNGIVIENTWVTKVSMPQVVNGGRAAVIDGKIYVMGGSSNYMYDPTTDTWTQKNPMPNQTIFFAIAAYQNRIYVFGGRGNNGACAFSQVYYPSNDSWEIIQSMPSPASDLNANVVNEKIYLIWESENKIYDISTDSWSNGTAMPYPVANYASAVYDNKIYYFGGNSERTVNQTQIYNPLTNAWALGAPIPTKGWESTSITAVATSGEFSLRRIYVLGGWSSGGLMGSDLNRVYNPIDDSWTYATPMPNARVGVTVSVVNDTLYAIGGSTSVFGGSTANEQYFPLGYGTPDITPTPTPSVPELSWLAMLPLLLSVFSVALLVKHRKTANLSK